MTAVVGFVGLGKLGLPVAVALALRGHEVLAYDVNPAHMSVDALPWYERSPDETTSLRACVDNSLPLRFVGLNDVVARSDCVFIAVETPHGPQFEGATPLPDARADYGYEPLIHVVRDVAQRASAPIEIGVMSTVMTGTMRSLVAPLAGEHSVVYCPQFVAMGSVARDLCHPEFTLLGHAEPRPSVVQDVLTKDVDAPVFVVSYESAELAKIVYNTFVSTKVALSNLVQRMSAEVGASTAEVLGVIRAAHHRLLSEAYIGPGMGDGGPCHPRDNVALSWLARRIGMGSDLFSAILVARETYVEWLAEKLLELADGLPLVILGTAYKPGTDIETGSSAMLMVNLLRLRNVQLTVVRSPKALEHSTVVREPAAFFVGCPEPQFISFEFPSGSVVVDSWHRVRPREGTKVFWIGESQSP